MGLLDQFTQAVDARKRYYGNIVRGLLDNPQALMEQLRAQNAENVTERARTAQETQSVMPGIAEPAQRAAFDEAMNMGLLGITAYHGSPHKFDKFDASKIGTGEGAQAYGHGLYFAENPGVARSYQPTELSINPTRGVPDELMDAYSKGYTTMLEAKGDVGAAKTSLQKQINIWLRRAKHEPDIADVANGKAAMYKQAIGLIDDGVYAVSKTNSSFYKVDIPDEAVARMLDWDKPLSQQPKAVQKYIEKELAVEIAAAKRTAPGWGDLSAPFDPSKEWTGSTILGMMRDSRANILSGSGPAVSAKLNAAGIPGIRYLDGGSRGAGSGTSNFVVFDPEIIKILSRE